MKSKISLIIVVLSLVGCLFHKLPPETKPVYVANEIMIRVGELQQTTIDLYDNKKIDKVLAQNIVEYTVATAKILKELPSGWKGMVKGGWETVNTKLGSIIPNELKAIWMLLDAMIRGLQ